MGNAASGQAGNRKKRTQQSAWNWEFKDGRAQIKPRAAAGRKAQPPRPLFRKLPSDNYDWWIFNPDPPKRSNSGKRRNTPRRDTR